MSLKKFKDFKKFNKTVEFSDLRESWKLLKDNSTLNSCTLILSFCKSKLQHEYLSFKAFYAFLYIFKWKK